MNLTILAKPIPGKKLESPTKEEVESLREKFGIATVREHTTSIGSVIILNGWYVYSDLPDTLKKGCKFVPGKLSGANEIESFVGSLHGRAF